MRIGRLQTQLNEPEIVRKGEGKYQGLPRLQVVSDYFPRLENPI